MTPKSTPIEDVENAVNWLGKVVVDFESRQEQRHDEREAAPAFARGAAG